MRLSLAAGLLGACQTHPSIFVPRCEGEPVPLAAADPSSLGFSAEEAAAWYGDLDTIEVTWTGRHSREPPSDTFDVAIGAITGEVVAVEHHPVVADATAAECATEDFVEFARAATVASRDGEVAGEGEVGLVLRKLALDDERTEIQVSVPEVVLAEPRWIEVDAAVTSDLPPPSTVTFHAYRGGFESVSISAEGDGYGLAVWKCDEQHHAGCASWSSIAP